MLCEVYKLRTTIMRSPTASTKVAVGDRAIVMRSL
jgi:hypothetical protein